MPQIDEHRSAEMGRGSIWKLLFRFSGPAIISMTVASTYNMVDRMWVGRIPGEEGLQSLAALGYAFPIMIAFMSILLGTGVGAASLISRRLGAGNRNGANRAAAMTITLSLILGILMTAIVLPNLDGILRLIGANDETLYDAAVLQQAKNYMSILTIFAFVNAFSLTIGSIIRAEGSPTFPSVVMIISALTNIALDPILIHGLNMGVSGAAYATVIARSLAAVIFIYYFVSRKSSFRFRLKNFLLHFGILKEIYKVGLASIVRMAAFAFVTILANRIATDLSAGGAGYVAVLSIMFSISSFAFMPTMGLGQGVLPLVGYNHGAGLTKRVGGVVSKASTIALGWGVMCTLIALLIPKQLMSIFNSDPAFLENGTTAMRIFAISFFTVGLQNVLSAFFQGMGRGIASLILASARQIIFLIPAILILPDIFQETGLWASFPVADLCAITLTLVWTIIAFKRMGIRFRLRYPNRNTQNP
ncbi:MAG: MATE family efflux transporter [Chloroflexi bacterium]|nr:MATE family efflux transporter [Chloroflexota bacterium]MBT7290579.1 MATE family efflux transporter [Chloroflexota bacterium]